MNRKDIFQNIYEKNIWGDSGNSETPSGPGSNLENAKNFAEELNHFIKRNNVKSILDVGCGASKWQELLEDIDYLGIDIVEFEKKLPFQQHDFVEKHLEGSYDVILMRNFIQHQTLPDIAKILENIKIMKPRFIITNFHKITQNKEIEDDNIYRFRKVNLTEHPFNLPLPIEQLRDSDQTMGVWLYSDLMNEEEDVEDQKDKSVLLAILAKNKEHTLKHFLSDIVNQTYPKKNITVYIRTNNNRDDTRNILFNFYNEYKDQYKKIIFEDADLPNVTNNENPHEWNYSRFKVLGEIRQHSLNICLEEKCDYYFVVDCDNFITPRTLEYLIKKRKPIIAPLLKPFPKLNDPYSNYFADINENGFYKSSELYYKILYRQIKGTFRVPVVHCTYLIDSKYIPRLKYIDEKMTYEFVIFSNSARLSHVPQYICNEIDFGELLHPDDDVTLEEEALIVKNHFILKDSSFLNYIIT